MSTEEEFGPMEPPIHPGELIRADFMPPLGLTPETLASAILVDAPMLARVLRGDRPIPVWLAARLGKYFGQGARFWVNLQALYDYQLWVYQESQRSYTILDRITPAVWPEAGPAATTED